MLVVNGSWPGSEARLAVESSSWSGLGRGHGRLTGRRAVVTVTRGSAPARRAVLDLGAGDVRRVAPVEVAAPPLVVTA